MTLYECRMKEKVFVKSIVDCEMKRRLLDLGFVNGTLVEPVLESPSKGMRAYLIKGCKIALRNNESKLIEVVKGEEHAL
ncbi:ferrous iron transport protein A [Absiella sp. AM54-8XD]|uniref:Ferrous iron transport protein A n=1 Tax=[Eubacterium] hominis TaxID=2764325 RepID=A0A7G9GMS7_9FIRM|nr:MULTISPECIES: FeoA family protein [Bacillota]QNM12109.1 ferrous iron transport protein A [[Eubacterium] hominis]RGB53176.1 ferrous iron transport protein A [Absiella sp. AM22-9]RGB59466.1 ferrous iron transport protein A [Absiella sp. AM10-20]RGB72857.1 ferrous iron transport protein A [Absiella sp. AM09-50]RHU07059.1 ferrous iron transport protein A [Absiella sp. AM27-20]